MCVYIFPIMVRNLLAALFFFWTTEIEWSIKCWQWQKWKIEFFPFLNVTITFIKRKVKHFRQMCDIETDVILKFIKILENWSQTAIMYHGDSWIYYRENKTTTCTKFPRKLIFSSLCLTLFSHHNYNSTFRMSVIIIARYKPWHCTV